MTMVMEQEPISVLVRRIWRDYIGLPSSWTVAQIDQHLAAETARIETMIDQADPGGQGLLVAKFWKDHGHGPDFLTKVNLINQHRMQVREQILAAELYEKIPPDEPELSMEEESERVEQLLEEEARQTQATMQALRSDPNRWKNALWLDEQTQEVVDLTRSLWGDQTTFFRLYMQSLLQVRREDDLPLPERRDSTLGVECSNLVNQLMIDEDRPHAVFRAENPPS